jgi:hypothetical protein
MGHPALLEADLQQLAWSVYRQALGVSRHRVDDVARRCFSSSCLAPLLRGGFKVAAYKNSYRRES